jgi:hypothetical protein
MTPINPGQYLLEIPLANARIGGALARIPAMGALIERVRGLAAAALAAAILAMPAWAQQGPLRVIVNHATAITLDAAATVVLIADPEVADVVNERNNLMFVLGRKPGATNLLVYDNAGNRLFEREVVVVPQDARTVTITRETDATDYSCDPRCAFREHLVGAPRSEIGTAAASPAGAAAAAPPPAFPAPPPSAEPSAGVVPPQPYGG